MPAKGGENTRLRVKPELFLISNLCSSELIKNLIMKKKPSDRHIDVPAEANRDKHINFIALENSDTDPADEPATGKLAPDKQAGENKKNSTKESKKK